MLFFSNETEKILQQWCDQEPEIEFKYAHGTKSVASKIVKILPNMVVMRGFTGKLQEADLDVRSIFSGWTFSTRVLKTGYAPSGDFLFYCSKPKKLKRPNLRTATRFLMYPNATLKTAITTNHGNKTVIFKVWDVSQFGCSLVNPSDVVFRAGTSLYQSVLTLGGSKPIHVNLEVVNTRTMERGGKEVEILGCKLKCDKKEVQEMLKIARKTGRPMQ